MKRTILVERQTRINLIKYFFIFVLVIIVLVPVSPYINPTPKTDSSVFQYVGQKVLQGSIPYKDIWDHKGPIIYYINAFAMLISGGSFWGVWLIEIVSLSLAASLGFKIMKKLYGEWAALFTLVLWLSTLPKIIFGGNFTEEFSLPIQFLSIYYVYKWIKNPQSKSAYFMLGLLLGVNFLLRPNNIGVQISFVIVYILTLIFGERKSFGIRGLGLFMAGVVISIGPWLVYFYSKNALSDFYTALIRFNFAYSSNQSMAVFLSQRFEAFESGINWMPILFSLGLSGWCLYLLKITRAKKLFSKENTLPIFFMLWLAIEVLFSLTNGKGYSHYYLMWLAPLSFLCAFFYSQIIAPAIDASDLNFNKSKTLLHSVLLISFSFQLLIAYLPQNISFIKGVVQNRGVPPIYTYNALIEYINDHYAEDTVVVWGNDVAIHLLLQKESPSRYIYLAPLYTLACNDEAVVNEFVNDLEAKKPIILDADYFNSTSLSREDKFCEGFQQIKSYINLNYAVDANIGDIDIYRYRGH